MSDARTSSELEALADEFWQGWLAAHPIWATSIGDRRYDDRLDDVAPAGIAAERARLSELLARAEAINPAPEGAGGRTTHASLVDELRREIDEIDAGLATWIVDPLEGPQVLFQTLPSFQPVTNPDQANAMVGRWRAMGPSIDEAIANLRRSLADGRVAARAPVERALDEVSDIAATPNASIALLEPARVDHADWPAGTQATFRRDLEEAVDRIVRPAFERYGACLRDEILPHARPDDRAGLLHVSDGVSAYRGLVRVHTTLDDDPEEIHSIGLAEVDRIDAEIADLGSRVLGTRSLADTLDRLRSDTALHFATSDEVAATAEAALRRAREAIPDWFGRLPQAECRVVRMAPFEEKHSTIAYYREPAADGSRPGEYMLNTSEPSTRPRYEAEALAFHESIPGHHLQIAIAQELEGLPAFRRHLGPTAFVEGWGLYTERLSDEMGLYSGDLDRFGILSFDAWRACRLVVDTGIHALGWTRAEAIDFMTAHTALAANNVANEVDRYIVWPGQALAYKIGQLEIRRLRSAAEAASPGSFDVRAFHDAVLGEGAVALGPLGGIVAAALGLEALALSR